MPASSLDLLKPEVLARIDRLSLRAQRVVEGSITGLHQSPLHGVSPEFAEHRQYNPGDDLKNLDWRVFAKTDRFFIKRFEEESNLRAMLVVDASGSMAYGRGAMTKYQYAATVAASLGYLLLRQRDAVGVATFDTDVRTVLPASSGSGQTAKLCHLLETTEPGEETSLGPVLMQVAGRLKRRGMVILFSDLLAEPKELDEALGRLLHDGHEILIVQVLDPDEVDLPFDRPVMFKDIEGSEQQLAEPRAFRKAYREAMKNFIGDIEHHCRFCGVGHLLLQTDTDLGQALGQFLHQRQQHGPGTRAGSVRQLQRITTSGPGGGG